MSLYFFSAIIKQEFSFLKTVSRQIHTYLNAQEKMINFVKDTFIV